MLGSRLKFLYLGSQHLADLTLAPREALNTKMIDNLNPCNFTSKEQAEGAAASKRLSLGETGMGNSSIVLCSPLCFLNLTKRVFSLTIKQ